MPELIVGLVIGVVLGLTVVAFLAIGSYERGYQAAQNATWRRELTARRSPATPRMTRSAA